MRRDAEGFRTEERRKGGVEEELLVVGWSLIGKTALFGLVIPTIGEISNAFFQCLTAFDLCLPAVVRLSLAKPILHCRVVCML